MCFQHSTTELRKVSSEIQLDISLNEEKFSKLPSYCPPNMTDSFHETSFVFLTVPNKTQNLNHRRFQRDPALFCVGTNVPQNKLLVNKD